MSMLTKRCRIDKSRKVRLITVYEEMLWTRCNQSDNNGSQQNKNNNNKTENNNKNYTVIF